MILLTMYISTMCSSTTRREAHVQQSANRTAHRQNPALARGRTAQHLDGVVNQFPTPTDQAQRGDLEGMVRSAELAGEGGLACRQVCGERSPCDP